MELLNITSTTLSSGTALPALGLNLGNAALERLQMNDAIAQTQAALDNFSEATLDRSDHQRTPDSTVCVKSNRPRTAAV